MLPTESVDTGHLPPADRFPFWLDITARATAPVAMSSEHAADFQAFARFVDLAGLRLTYFRYQSLTGRRTSRMIRRDDPDVFQLALPLSGTSWISALRRDTSLRNANFTLLDYRRPHQLMHTGPDDGRTPAASLTVVLPRELLPIPSNKLDRLTASQLPGAEGMGALLAQHMRHITTYPEQYDASEAPRLSRITLDLVSSLLARHLDTEAALPVDVRQQTLLVQVRAFVERHLGDASLTPQTVADAHHISLRSLHRLFAGEEETVARMIRRHRLERCRRDLADPRLRDRAVQAIGWRWGFTDKTHFSRAFRAAYGMSPQSYRRAEELARNVNPVAPTGNDPPAYWPLTG
ncbi:helix-turn-helix domain-containing protein [Micromonospora sp. WMMD882]|uniref:AraC-like ligand-binding domain-containing protein n=1 Tax=Micromonospora sp. WMMD882 TaxID=3015151 RepID=UPI00248AB1AA|nr:helix-turn-helix domain-containing protein [Micromonospora sp. WMMD882]WBB81457.1 helix-turn-helix domain-containing protein [Micromonospora sp. WMMD882]